MSEVILSRIKTIINNGCSLNALANLLTYYKVNNRIVNTTRTHKVLLVEDSMVIDLKLLKKEKNYNWRIPKVKDYQKQTGKTISI